MKPSPRQKSSSTVATRALLCVLVCLLVAAGIFTSTKAPAQSAATIATTQKLYSVGETMVINGAGFSANANIYITVLRPDKLTDSVLPLPITSGSGAFTASYTPPLEPGRYTITATDGTNTAVTAVTEADAIGYNKGVYNKSATAPEDTTGNWTTGNAGSNYLENQWSFYQYEITGIGSTVPSFDVIYNHFQANTNAVFIDALADFRACIDCTDSSHTSGPSQGMLLDTDPLPPTSQTNWVLAAGAVSNFNRPLNTAADGSGTTVLTGSAGFCSSNTPEPIPDMVTTFPAQFHCFHVDGTKLASLFPGQLSSGTHTITLFYAAHLAASFVWGNGSPGVGGHEASLGDCTTPYYVHPLTGPLASFEPPSTPTCTSFPAVYGTDDYAGWTAAGFGVGFATGSSRHFELSNQSAGSSGAIDLPIPTVAAPSNTIIIRKVTNPANATGVTFPFTSSQLGNFSLTSPFPSSKTFTGIAGGVEYDVTETSVTGWTFQNVSCAVTAGTDDGTGTWPTSSTSPTAAITLGATDSGVTLTCTFTNNGSATLQLVKNVVSTNGGTATASQWTTSAAGPTPISGAGGVGPSQVLAGTYTLSETGTVAGYTNGTTYSCVTNGGAPVSENSITLNPGDSAVCTITNHDNPAHLALVKNVVSTNGGTATASQWNLSAAGPTPLSGAGGVASSPVNQGTYNLSETGTVAGYTNGTTYSCVLNGGAPVSENSISLTVGDTAVCTITNHDNPAHLALVKNVVSTNGGTATASQWNLSAAGPTPLSGAGGVASSPVNQGTYNLSETGTVAGYTNGTTYSCVLNGGAPVSENSISLTVGDTAVCTITNHDNPAHLQLIKNVINLFGTPAAATNWTTSAAGPTPISGAGGVGPSPVNQGTYTLSESGSVSGYTNGTTYSCVLNGGAPVSENSISLIVGDSAVCTITNTAQPAHLTLIKSVINNFGPAAPITSWTTIATGASAGATSSISGAGGVSSDVNDGTYTLSESGSVQGYTNGTGYLCAGTGTQNSPTSVTVGPGQSETCTITNTAQPPTLTIIKTIQGTFTGATFSFDVTGPTTLNAGTIPSTNLTPSSSPGSATFGPQVIMDGSGYQIAEHTPLPAGYTLTDATCVDNSTFTTPTPGPLDSNNVPLFWNFNAVPGSQIVCTYINNNQQATRTQGFWATHTALANNIWNGTGNPFPGVSPVAGSPDATLCGVIITALPSPPEENVLMGGFWANISHKSTGQKRLAIDQARMQMLQQYLAAVLNVHMFGSGSEAMLVTARNAYCSNNASAIQAQVGILGTFNSQGDTLGTTPGGSATAQASKAQADINAWDTPEFAGLSDEDGAPKLALAKVVSGGSAATTDFTLTATCTAGPCSGSKSGAGGFPSTTVVEGTYTLSDTGDTNTAGYTPGAWACAGTGTFTIGPTTGGTATLVIDQGAVVSCSITNTHP